MPGSTAAPAASTSYWSPNHTNGLSIIGDTHAGVVAHVGHLVSDEFPCGTAMRHEYAELGELLQGGRELSYLCGTSHRG